MIVPILSKDFLLGEVDIDDDFPDFFGTPQGTFYKRTLVTETRTETQILVAIVDILVEEGVTNNQIDKYFNLKPNVLNFLFAYGRIIRESRK